MTIEQLNNEISFLAKRIENIKEQIKFPTTEKDIILQMEKFLTVSFHFSNLEYFLSRIFDRFFLFFSSPIKRF